MSIENKVPKWRAKASVLLTVVACLMALFHEYTTATLPLSGFMQMAVHLGFAMTIVGLAQIAGDKSNHFTVWDMVGVIIIVFGLVTNLRILATKGFISPKLTANLSTMDTILAVLIIVGILLAVQRAIIEKDALVHVHPYGAISVGEKGERLADLDGLAPGVIAFSDDGRGVQSESLMREAMMQCRRLGKILAAHCEDNSLLHGGYIHDGAYARAHGHRGICSESEWGPIARDLRLAEETGCAYHVCHVSTKESVALIRAAKRRGVDVTCETAPHYLTFTDEDLQEDGRFKMNPPLRAREDRDALIEGLLDGTIDMLVTDHAPHSREEKGRGLEKSAMGVVGLETSFAASYTALVQTGILPLEKLVDLMHGAPMRRFGCGTELAEGQPADLTAFDLTKTYTVDPETFLTMGRATPFAGCALTGVCKLTMIGGEPVWKEETL